MKQNRTWAVVSVVAVLGLLLGSLGRQAEAQAEKPIELIYHFPLAQATNTAVVQWWMDEVEKRTNGKVKFKRVWGGALGSLPEQPTNIRGRVFDLGNVSSVYSPGILAVETVTILPFLSDNFRAVQKAQNDFIRSKVVQGQYAGLNAQPLFAYTNEALEVISYVRATTIEQLKPLKIRAHGGAADALTAAGLTSVAIQWGELSAAFERRVVDAAVVPIVAARDTGFHELTKFVLRVPIYYFSWTVAMNVQAWNGLPKDIQGVMLEVALETPDKNTDLFEKKFIPEAWADFRKAGVQEVKWSEKEMAKFRALGGEPVWNAWVKAMTAKGHDGQRILDDFRALLTKHGG